MEPCAPPTASRRDVRLAPCAEIGIGLTGAGLLFMLLGMMMFFDKGLLAMGNVRRVLSGPRLHIAATVLTVAASASADPVPFGSDDDHRHQQDLPLLLPEAQAQRWSALLPERAHSRLATSPLGSRPALPPTPALASRQARRASWAAIGLVLLGWPVIGKEGRGLRLPQPYSGAQSPQRLLIDRTPANLTLASPSPSPSP